MRGAVGICVYFLQNLYSLFKNPKKNSTYSITLLFPYITHVILRNWGIYRALVQGFVLHADGSTYITIVFKGVAAIVLL
jgi:hypothetical protein